MSHSTTATATYILQKYSKSYNAHPDRQGNSDWQHFTNPTIRLILDVKKSSKSELESVRLRIVWTMDTPSSNNRSEVVFEDIDLLSFSSLSSRKPDKKQVQSLPLKAVYRDLIVGIRYLYTQGSDSSNPVYRRFQITFASSSDVSEFINSISSICPCKANASSGQNPVTMYTGSIAPSQYPAAMSSTSILARNNPSPQPGQQLPEVYSSPTFSPRIQPFNPSPTPYFPAGPASSSSHQDSLHLMPKLPQMIHPRPSIHLQHSPSQSHFEVSRYSSSNLPDDRRSQTSLVNSATYSATMSTAELPFSHLASSAPPSRPEVADKTVQTQDAFLAALHEATPLYNLSHCALEKLVGDVIREDGFVDLMESLSSMWRIKGYLNHKGYFNQ